MAFQVSGLLGIEVNLKITNPSIICMCYPVAKMEHIMDDHWTHLVGKVEDHPNHAIHHRENIFKPYLDDTGSHKVFGLLSSDCVPGLKND